MTYSVMWTVLPEGYAPSGRLQLTLIASLTVSDTRPILGDSPLRDWPAAVRELGPWHVAVRGESTPRRATLLTDPPDSDLWRTIFPFSTRVEKTAAVPPAIPIAAAPASFTAAADALSSLFATGAGVTNDFADDHPAMLALRAVAGDRGLRAGGRVLGDDAARSAARGVADPIAAYAASLRTPAQRRRPAGRSSPSVPAGPKPLDDITEVPRADFHQVVGLLLTHPALATLLGLRLRLEIDAFDGERLIRAVDAAGRPVQGEAPVRQPWSRVLARSSARRFVMATQLSDPPEVVEGMLDVASPARRKEYRLTSLDVPGLTAQIEAHAQALVAEGELRSGEPAAPGALPPSRNRLPVRRDVGLTLARVIWARALADRSSGAEQIDGDPVLYADDVTAGFRLDVSRDGGPFRSVMHRKANYRVGEREISVVEEGRIEGIVGAQQTDAEDVTTLLAGEELAAWDGWGIAVPKPGPKVAAQRGAPSPVEVIEPTLIEGYGIQVTLAPARGTLPRLRFGSTYAVRLRAVDVGGTSIAGEVADPAQRIDAGPYLRHESAPGPYVLPRRRYTFGESNQRLVVRGNEGVGGRDEPTGERHLAPPTASFALCELHGLFDPAYGPSVPPAERRRLLDLARRESGTFLDPTVIGPTGTPVPAPGIAVITNDPDHDPGVSLPIPRGSALPNGAYVIHDTDLPRTPYLPDPIVTGVTLSGLDGLPPLTVPYRGGAWPDRQPIRLIVRPTSKAEPKLVARAVSSAGGTAIVVFVPPGFDGTFELSSALDPARVGELATAGAATADITAGMVLGLSARQAMSVVHPVRKPLAPPTLVGGVKFAVVPGALAVAGTVRYDTHRATTGTVDVVATWREQRDPGAGPLVDDDRRTTVGSAIVEAVPPGQAAGPTEVTVRHDFGDTRHRRVDYRGVAATRFAEYFPRVADGDPGQRVEGQPATATILNRARPTPPSMHSVIPLFSHTQTISGTTVTQTRLTSGVRVWLRRPWLQTGQDERLGVVLLRATAPGPGEAPVNLPRMRPYVTRWGTDPIAQGADAPASDLKTIDFGRRIASESVDRPLIDAALAGQQGRIVSHAVHYDPERQLWFADVDLNVPDDWWPFVRLALVRYQPQTVPGCSTVSEIVLTDFAQLPPQRQVIAAREGSLGVRVKVVGAKPPIPVADAGLAYSVRQERRMPEPLDTSLDLGTDTGVGAAEGWTVTSGPLPGPFDRANLLLTWTGPANPGPPGAVVDQLRAGRVVVEETVSGLPLLGSGPTSRVTFTATIDRALLGIG